MKNITMASLLVMAALSPVLAESKFTPPNGQVLLFVGQDIDSIADYVKAVGTVPAGFMCYTSLQGLEGLDELADPGGGIQHASVLVEKYPNTALQIGLYMVNELEATAAGRLDENIDKLGDWIKKADRPVFLRIGYEFDLPDNHYDAKQYVAAFRYIVDRFRKNGVNNVAYVWHSYAQGRTPDKMMEWYPGDDYVDWVGASYFNQFPKFIAVVSDVAAKVNKPFMLAETSSWYIKNETQREIFFKRLFAMIDADHVSALCYINANWNDQPMWQSQNYGDGRVQPYATVFDVWMQETSKSMFLKSSPDFFKAIKFQN